LVDFPDLQARLRADQLAKKWGQSMPKFGGKDLTDARPFNLMFQTQMGARPIRHRSRIYDRKRRNRFSCIQNVLDVSRKKTPFGIAQIGKHFGTRLTHRTLPSLARVWSKWSSNIFAGRSGDGFAGLLVERRIRFYGEIGISPKRLHVLDVPEKSGHFIPKARSTRIPNFPLGDRS